MPQFHKMQEAGKAMPHLGKLLQQVMNERVITKTELAKKLDITPARGLFNKLCH